MHQLGHGQCSDVLDFGWAVELIGAFPPSRTWPPYCHYDSCRRPWLSSAAGHYYFFYFTYMHSQAAPPFALNVESVPTTSTNTSWFLEVQKPLQKGKSCWCCGSVMVLAYRNTSPSSLVETNHLYLTFHKRTDLSFGPQSWSLFRILSQSLTDESSKHRTKTAVHWWDYTSSSCIRHYQTIFLAPNPFTS